MVSLTLLANHNVRIKQEIKEEANEHLLVPSENGVPQGSLNPHEHKYRVASWCLAAKLGRRTYPNANLARPTYSESCSIAL